MMRKWGTSEVHILPFTLSEEEDQDSSCIEYSKPFITTKMKHGVRTLNLRRFTSHSRCNN